MTHDVVQWLNEIRALQERLSRVNQDRTDAYQQASRWHQSYQTEAIQRRADVKRLQQSINSLVAENQRLKQRLTSAPSPVIPPPPPVPRVSPTHSLVTSTDHPQGEQYDALQQQLTEAIALSDRLSRALRQEQQDHAQTRQTLMEALSDTIEQLERERKRYPSSPAEQNHAHDPLALPEVSTQSPLSGSLSQPEAPDQPLPDASEMDEV